MGFFKKEKKEIVDVQPFSTPYESKTNESCDGLTRAMDNAADVATMRHVLLQFTNWFKSNFKELPLLQADPFVDDWCNGMTRIICQTLQRNKKEKTRTRYETGVIG